MKKLTAYLSFEEVRGKMRLTLWDEPGEDRVEASGVVERDGSVTLHSLGPVPRHKELPIFQLG